MSICVSSWAAPHAGFSGALGAGLAILSRFPIIGATINPYSLNGSPIEVIQGDWFVGKAAASVLLAHPVLGQLQIFNTHVRFYRTAFALVLLKLQYSFLHPVATQALSTYKPTA